MPVTLLFAVFALLALVVIFLITYRAKGLATALLTTGVGTVFAFALYVAVITAIVKAME